jgi:hypothetical protein
MNHLKIKRSKINGDGLYSTKLIKKGSRVGLIQGETVIVKKFTAKLSQQSLNWIGIGRYSWINTKNSPFKYINHSCDPNTYILGKQTILALKNIEAGDEVTMDYSLTEADEGWSIDQCTCGNSNCRKKIGPITTLSEKEFTRLKSIIPSNFQKIFLVEKKRLTS